jgi:hypothetical protein
MQADDTIEQWLPVPGRPRYLVSDRGRVASVMTQATGLYGHRSLRLGTRKDHEFRQVHRMVLEAFVGPAPQGMVGAHLDGNPGNNRLENLVWVTQKENIRHKYEHASYPKMTWEKVRELRRLALTGTPQIELARRFDLSNGYVSRLVAGLAWKE